MKEIREKINRKLNTMVNQYYIQSRTLNTKELREKAGERYQVGKKMLRIINEVFDEADTLSE
jgi:predicted lysophospholipase L1 biosynthesis ABC-type transport system permease subunit